MNAQINAAVQSATRTWSVHQSALFDWAATGTGNIVVKAVAGSGKTTTGVEMTRRMRGRHIYLAFNKAIATELASRGVNGKTFHALCYGPVLQHTGASQVEPNKLQSLLRENFGDDVRRNYGTFMMKLVGLARNAGIGAGLAPNVMGEYLALAEHHDLEPDGDNGTMEEGVEKAMELMALSNASPLIDFDDMLYIAVRDGLSLPKFDNVLVDEAQDTNPIRRAIIRKIMKPNSRLAAIGDPAQAIYGFTGADSDSMALIAQDFACVEMPLTVTYRCPTAVVEYAQNWMADIQAAPGAAEGTVDALHDWNNKVFAEGDMVVCRTTRPLISLAYSLIRDRIPAHVMGREIGQGLVKLVNKMKAKGIDALVSKLAAYTSREAEKAIAKGQDGKAETIRDKSACIMVMVESLSENDRTIPALLRSIESLFSDANGGVTLATIHKSKGLEANRVFWLNRSKCPSMWARQEWQQDQEANLCYVATTRAKQALFMIEEKE